MLQLTRQLGVSHSLLHARFGSKRALWEAAVDHCLERVRAMYDTDGGRLDGDVDWDRAVGMNTPGQSGDTRSPFYRNLFEFWANDQFHPVFYSRDKIEEVTAVEIQLRPGG